jgi:hypothetical protein
VMCVTLASVFSYETLCEATFIHFNKESPHIIRTHFYDMRLLVAPNNDIVVNNVNISDTQDSLCEPL